MSTRNSKPSFELAPLSALRMLWKQKMTILVTSVLAIVTTGVIVYELPAIYRAEALILVDSQKIPEKYVTSTVNTDVGDRLATIGQQIMTTTRLLKIIDDYNLYQVERKKLTQEEIIERMRKDISLKVEKGWTGGRPGAFRVGYEGQTPGLVAEITNKLANFYVEENLKTREVQAEGTADFINSQVATAKKKLDEQEAKVSEFKMRHTGELPEQENSILSTISSLQVQLQGNQDAVNRAQQNKMALESTLSTAQVADKVLSAPRPEYGAPVAASEPTIVPKKRSELLQEQLDQIKLRYKESHPDVQLMQAEIDRSKREEQAAEAAAKTATATQRTSPDGISTPPPPRPISKELVASRERLNDLETKVSMVVKEIAYLESDRQKILRSIASYQSRVDRLPLVEQQMAALTRDYEISKSNYRSLLDKQLSAGMATDMERRQKSERFEVIDPARVPEKPVSPNRPLLLTIGVILSLALGLVLGFGIEIRKSALLGEWELQPDIPILGRIPRIAPLKSAGQSFAVHPSTVTGLIAIAISTIRKSV